MYIALLSDVATVYTNILEYDELIILAGEKVDIYTQILNSDAKKYKQGVIGTTQLNNSAKISKLLKVNLKT